MSGLKKLQRVKHARSQAIELGKYEAVNAAESHAVRRLAAQHVQLMPEHKDFGLQRRPRPEQPDQSTQDLAAKLAHHPGSIIDSRLPAKRLGFR